MLSGNYENWFHSCYLRLKDWTGGWKNLNFLNEKLFENIEKLCEWEVCLGSFKNYETLMESRKFITIYGLKLKKSLQIQWQDEIKVRIKSHSFRNCQILEEKYSHNLKLDLHFNKLKIFNISKLLDRRAKMN